MSRKIIVAVTGASGAAYAKRLLEVLAVAGCEIHLVVSANGRRLIADELGIAELSPQAFLASPAPGSILIHANNDVGAPPASGSFLTDGMVVCPCSSNTLGQIAAGVASNLITRAAAVHLKECRRLVLLTREMPISQIDIRNMLRVSRAGGVICPASPGFYMTPKSVGDLVDFVVGRLCDLLGVAHMLNTRWDPKQAGASASRPSAIGG